MPGSANKRFHFNPALVRRGRRPWPVLLAGVLILLVALLPAGAERSDTSAATLRRYEGILRYPGPLRNPIGFHWNAAAYPDPGAIRSVMPLLKSMKVGWMKLVVDGESGLAASRLLAENGIEPIARLYVSGPHPYFKVDPAHVRKYVAAGVHYFEYGNEPNSPDEWLNRSIPPHSAELLADQWLANSRIIREAGGVALFPAMMPGAGGKELFRSVFEVVRTRGQLDSFTGAAIAVHNRPFNHPLDYPDDPLNRRSGSYAAVGADDTTFRSYEVFDDIVFEYLGVSLPLLATEAGYVIGSSEDARYPLINVDRHRQGNLDIVTGFRDGRWRDSLVNQNFWMLGSFGHPGWPADAWLANPEYGGRDLPAVNALQGLAPFERRYLVDRLSRPQNELSPPPPYRFRQGDWEAVVTVSNANPPGGSFVGVNVQTLTAGRPLVGSRVELVTKYRNHEGFDRFPDSDRDGRTLRAIAVPLDETEGNWEFTTIGPNGDRRSFSIGVQVSVATPVPTASPSPTVSPTATASPVPSPSATPSATLTPTRTPKAEPSSTPTSSPSPTLTPTSTSTPTHPPTATSSPTAPRATPTKQPSSATPLGTTHGGSQGG